MSASFPPNRCPQMAAADPSWDPTTCVRCGGGSRRWCTPACARWWLDNHEWGSARAARLAADHHRCVRCPHPGDYVDAAVALIALLSSRDPRGLHHLLTHGEEAVALAVVVRLARHVSGWAVDDRYSLADAEEAAATLTTTSTLAADWARFQRLRRLEVNHITPRRGRGYAMGCHHHQDGLETLCHACHVKVTAEQRRAAQAVPDAA